MLDGYRAQIAALDREEKQTVAQLQTLVRASGSTLGEPSRSKPRSGILDGDRWPRATISQGRGLT
jgi:hypothetical protein